MPGHEQNAFVTGYSRALPVEGKIGIHMALLEAHPESQAKEQAALRRPMLLKSGLEALKKWWQEANSSLSAAERDEQDLSFALDKMEKAIQENANAIYVEDANWSWAKTAILMEHFQAITMDERLAMRRKFQQEIRQSNPLVSREELKSHLETAMIMAALKWRKSGLQSKKDALLSAALAERIKEH